MHLAPGELQGSHRHRIGHARARDSEAIRLRAKCGDPAFCVLLDSRSQKVRASRLTLPGFSFSFCTFSPLFGFLGCALCRFKFGPAVGYQAWVPVSISLKVIGTRGCLWHVHTSTTPHLLTWPFGHGTKRRRATLSFGVVPRRTLSRGSHGFFGVKRHVIG